MDINNNSIVADMDIDIVVECFIAAINDVSKGLIYV